MMASGFSTAPILITSAITKFRKHSSHLASFKNCTINTQIDFILVRHLYKKLVIEAEVVAKFELLDGV